MPQGRIAAAAGEPSVIQVEGPRHRGETMRWFWIDRFVAFERGSRAVAIKNVTMAEEHLDGMGIGVFAMPASLILEGLAQTGGLLVAECNEFRERVVLAKVTRARFHCPALPGHQLTYTAHCQDVRADGAIVSGTSHLGETLQAEVDIMFAHLDERFPSDLFEPVAFLSMLRHLKLYDVGRDEQGEPLKIPDHLLQAEARAFSPG